MKKLVFAAVLASGICALPVLAIELGAPFSDGMVLQRGRRVPVWGEGTPGSEIWVSFDEVSAVAIVDTNGYWRVDLPALDTSAVGRILTVVERSGGQTIDIVHIVDVLVGEVWFASGQSNMECPIWGSDGRYRDGKGGLMTRITRLDRLRFVKTPRAWSVVPKKLKATWQTFEPKNFKTDNQLSAIAFYYARELYLALGVPIGIIDCSWGGTNIDAWTPREAYADCPDVLRPTADYPVRLDFEADRDKRGPIYGPNQQPTVLWNGMVRAYAPMAVRGMIWYQGCCNASPEESPLYCAKMHLLYKGWSEAFENPDLRLYFVQLAPYRQNWNAIVAQQNQFAAEEKNAAIVVTADIGNFDDIHPNDKETIAKRLLAQALVRDYGLTGFDPDSPVFRAMRVEEDMVFLSFEHAEGWYVYSKDRSLTPPFELAGTNGEWHAAMILNVQDKYKRGPFEGREIVLRSETVSHPVSVRYMGRPRTAGTLYNENSLPLGAFEASVR